MPNFISCSINFLTRVFNTIGLTAEHILAEKANNLPNWPCPGPFCEQLPTSACHVQQQPLRLDWK
ncbi:hypothetical protein, partial [Bifidobacterium longum]|uniref:hypothetical protein n=1 Tax=Bifidobacterium longum TaxID=216816 RepID=UPI00299061A9